MIKLQSIDGVERRLSPVFVCDVCGKAIDNIGMGVMAYRDGGLGEGDLYDALHAHKRGCHDIAEAALVGKEPGPWEELTVHVIEIVMGTRLPIGEVVSRVLGRAIAMMPDDCDELIQHWEELADFFRARGLD